MPHILPAGAGVSPEEALAAKAASRTRLLCSLDSALLAAGQLHKAVTTICPEAVAALATQTMPDTKNLTVEQKLALGGHMAGELTAVVFNLAPEVAFAQVETALPTDTASQVKTATAIAAAQGRAV
jgi:hypothetical protein